MSLLDLMEANPYVKVKELEQLPGVYACNFTRKAFYRQHWDSQTITARGLFLNKEGRVVARGYDKFFELGEPLCPYRTMSDVYQAAQQGEATFSVKHNGYLCVASVVNGHLRLFSKSGITAYSREAERILQETVSRKNIRNLATILEAHNASATFEVLSPRDKHIIDEPRNRVVLLDFIRNSAEYRPMPELFDNLTGVETAVKQPLTGKLDTNRTDVEGYVITLPYGSMVKIKTLYYKQVKDLRACLTNPKHEPRYEQTREWLNIVRSRNLTIPTYQNLVAVNIIDMIELMKEIKNA